MNRFYVYEHWRPDTDTCFWVGKGTGYRSRRFKRNRHYNLVAANLARKGMCVEVRLVAEALSEEDAFKIEAERIAFWRSAGIKLTNRTMGGDGNWGLSVSVATREKLRRANLGKKHSEETRALMSRSRTGKGYGGRPAGFNHFPETIEKISKGNSGKVRSAEAKERLRAANIGKKHSLETRSKMSAAKIGNKNATGGKGLRRSEETKARMSAAQKGHPVSEEARANMRAAALRYRQRISETAK